MDTFVALHRNKFMANWQTWRTFRAIAARETVSEARVSQLAHMRRQMRYRALQYGEARGWDMGPYTDKV